MSATDHIKSFCNHLFVEKGYSKNTVISYQTDLLEFRDYLSATYELNHIAGATTMMLRSWLSSMKESGMEARSVNRKLSATRSFYKFLLRRQIIDKSPASPIRALKVGKPLPVFVEEQKINQVLHRSFYPQGFDGDTRFLIILFLYSTGARVSELALLEEKDIRPAAGIAILHGKGNKQRNIPLSPELLQTIQYYRNEKRRLFENPAGTLLASSKNKSLSRGMIYKKVKETLLEITTITKKSPHVLRHSFATHLSNHGASIGAIKDLLGHASLAATQIYTHTSIARLKEIYNKAHPKS